jgi:hypothetical protein
LTFAAPRTILADGFPLSGKWKMAVSTLTQPTLRPVDVAVALRLVLEPGDHFEAMAHALGIGVSAAHRSLERLKASGLLLPGRRVIARARLLEFLSHGVRYAFYPVLGPEAPGVPTAHSGPPLAARIAAERPLVWPSATGDVRGDTLLPLYEKAPGLAGRDAELYELLTLVDALRVGQARERRLATELLDERLRARREG